jgi:hypothetical protein
MKSIRLSSFVIAAVATAAILSTERTQAAPIVVQNFSFEDPAIPDNSITAYPNPSAPNQITDWTAPNIAGIYNPTGSGAYTSISDGTQIAFNDSSTPIAQTLGVDLEAGVYTLTIATGWRLDGANIYAGGSFGLYTVTGDTALASQALVSPAVQGTFADESVTLTVLAGDPNIGNPFQIELSGYSPHTDATTDFDNIRLDYVPAPEPSTFALVAVAMAGLFGMARMRRLVS